MPDSHAANDVGAECGPLVRVLGHDLPRAVRVAAAAPHHLDEARLVRVAGDVGGDVAAVAENGLASEQLGGLRPFDRGGVSGSGPAVTLRSS